MNEEKIRLLESLGCREPVKRGYRLDKVAGLAQFRAYTFACKSDVFGCHGISKEQVIILDGKAYVGNGKILDLDKAFNTGLVLGKTPLLLNTANYDALVMLGKARYLLFGYPVFPCKIVRLKLSYMKEPVKSFFPIFDSPLKLKLAEIVPIAWKEPVRRIEIPKPKDDINVVRMEIAELKKLLEKSANAQDTGQVLPQLTERQNQVLLLFRKGFTGKDIAEQLRISQPAVTKIKKSIEKKLGKMG